MFGADQAVFLVVVCGSPGGGLCEQGSMYVEPMVALTGGDAVLDFIWTLGLASSSSDSRFVV